MSEALGLFCSTKTEVGKDAKVVKKEASGGSSMYQTQKQKTLK
jgi:hypothetical protein